jgi:RNA polymerase sigma-70 factor (ECF subfamily)
MAEVFRVAWVHRNDDEPVFTLRWLYSALHNVVGNEYRRRSRLARLRERLGGLRPIPSGRDVDSGLDALAVREAVAKLDAQERDLIGMLFWDELSRAEVASVLGCSVNAVTLRLQRARRHLAGQMIALDPEQ